MMNVSMQQQQAHPQYALPPQQHQQQQQQQQQHATPSQTGKRNAASAGLPDMVSTLPPGHRGNEHLNDLHMGAVADGTQDLLKAVNHPSDMLDHSDDDDDTLHLDGGVNSSGTPGVMMNGRESIGSNPKTPIVGGRKTGSKNYVSSEHKQFLHLVSKLQAYLEGPQGEKWVEISLRLYRKVGYRRDPVVLHDHFVEMTNVGRTIMRENSLVFPFTGEVSIHEVSPEDIESAYNDLGEQMYMGFQNRPGKKLCPTAWWDAEVFGAVAHVIQEMDQNNPDAVNDISLFSRRREFDTEEKTNEPANRIILPSLDSAKKHQSSSSNTATPGLKEDLAEIKASAKQLQKLEDRIGKLEEKMDIILTHLGVQHP